MNRGLVWGIGAVAVIAAAYLAGYLPENRQRVAATTEAAALQTRLATAEARVRAGELLGQALTLKEIAIRQDYGQALERSSAFFDAVRGEAATTPEPRLREGLAAVLARRDAVTAALAKTEPTAVELIHDIERLLRGAMGYAMLPEPRREP